MRRAFTRAGACLSAGAGALVLVVGGGAAPAAAHAELLETQPTAGEQLDEAPDQVILTYSEHVDPFDDAIEVFDSSGEQVETTAPGHLDGRPQLVSVDLPDLEEGSYVVTWRVASEDSHPIRGAFTFRIGAATDGAEAEALMDRLAEEEGGDPTVGFLFGVVRFAGFVGTVLLVGGALFLVGLWPSGIADRRARRLVLFGWGTTVVATVLGFGFQAAYSEGDGIGGIVKTGPIGDVFGTRPGRVWLIRLGSLAVVAVVASLYGRRRAAVAPAADGSAGRAPVDSTGLAAVAVLGLGLLATISFAGHAGAGDFVVLALVTDLVHLGGVAFWLGGLAMLFAAVLRRSDPVPSTATSTVGAAGVTTDPDAEADAATGAPAAVGTAGATVAGVVARFSTLAMVAVAAIAVSGVVQGWRQLRGFDALFDSTYGQVLIVKVVLFAVMIAGAAVSRSWVQRRSSWTGAGETAATAEAAESDAVAPPPPPPPPPPLRTLRLSVGLEAGVAALVLGVTALLVNTVPGKDATTPGTFAAELHGSAVMVQVEVDPVRVGLADFRFTTLSHEGQPIEPPGVEASIALPDQDLPPIPLALESQGDGLYVAEDADIPMAGTWTLAVNVRVSEFDQDALSTELPVE